MIVVQPKTNYRYWQAAAKSQPARPANARFGFGDTLATRVFQPITEQFVWGFLFQDVLALWIPRIINALRRGRTPYELNEDPAIRDKHPLQQWLHSIYKNAAGLNYKNSVEESLREIETGPGIFIAQSLLLGLGSTMALGKLSLLMGRDDLHAYKAAFDRVLGNNNLPECLNGKLSPQFFEDRLLKQFMSKLLVQGHFQPGLSKTLPIEAITSAFSHIDDEPAFFNQLMKVDPDKALYRFMEQVLKDAQKSNPGKKLSEITYGEVLNKWINKWVLFNDKAGTLTSRFQTTQDMENVFKRLVHWFNDDALKLGNSVALNHLDMPLLGQGKTETAELLLENVRKFRTFIQDSHLLARGEISSVCEAGWGENMRRALISSANKVFRKTIILKPFLGFAGTLLAGLTVVSISALAQNKDHKYPANRNVDLSQLNPMGNGLDTTGFNNNHTTDSYVSHQYRQPMFQSAAVSLFPSFGNPASAQRRMP